MALPAIVEDNRRLGEAIDQLATTAYRGFMEYGMVVNFKQGKSGIVAGIHGSRQHAARTECYGSPTRAVDTGFGVMEVYKQHSYKLLGGRSEERR